jgi:hypothetical protein
VHYLRELMAKINKADKTQEYDYNNNKLDVEQDCRQQHRKDFEEDEGVFDIDDESFFHASQYQKAGWENEEVAQIKDKALTHRSGVFKGKGRRVKGKGMDVETEDQEEDYGVEGEGEGEGKGEGDNESEEKGKDAEDYEEEMSDFYPDDEEDDSETERKRVMMNKRKNIDKKKTKNAEVFVTVMRDGKQVKVKKRNPIRFVDIEKELKSNWWKESVNSVVNMARRCYSLSRNAEKIVNGVRESFLLFLQTGISADIPFSSSPLTYWTYILHDRDLFIHQDIARLALSMTSTLASEAPCERVFSKMKMLVGDRRFNLSPRTIFHMFVITGI